MRATELSFGAEIGTWEIVHSIGGICPGFGMACC